VTVCVVGCYWSKDPRKNAQKNDKKNKISDTMNRIMPHRSPFITDLVCNP
jgi:hypothetical protein